MGSQRGAIRPWCCEGVPATTTQWKAVVKQWSCDASLAQAEDNRTVWGTRQPRSLSMLHMAGRRAMARQSVYSRFRRAK